MTTFDEAWYAEIIERFTCDTQDRQINDSIDGLGRCILVASCILAQAIDGLASKVEHVSSSIAEHD